VTLIRRLIAERIAEDEAVANGVIDEASDLSPVPSRVPAVSAFLERWDPWRVFATCVIRRPGQPPRLPGRMVECAGEPTLMSDQQAECVEQPLVTPLPTCTPG
jgi:hypothetical protein